MLSVSSSQDHMVDSWIMDSTCSYHMKPNKDWFDAHKLENSGSILMGNDASCRQMDFQILEGDYRLWHHGQ